MAGEKKICMDKICIVRTGGATALARKDTILIFHYYTEILEVVSFHKKRGLFGPMVLEVQSLEAFM